jgi:hypothetical protein
MRISFLRYVCGRMVTEKTSGTLKVLFYHEDEFLGRPGSSISREQD